MGATVKTHGLNRSTSPFLPGLQDVTYDVDFRQNLRTNRRTGATQRLKWGVVPRAPAAPPMAGKTQYQWDTWHS